MNSITPYLVILDSIKSSEGLQLNTRTDNDNLWIEEVHFTKARSADLFQLDFSGKGILSPSLSAKEKEFCRAHQISYLTKDGSLSLVRKRSVLSVEPREIKKRSRREKTITQPWENTSIKPTDIVSPNSFSILDVLFRLPEQKIREFRSGLQFTKTFDLYQPKLSILMTAMKAHDLADLRAKIRNLSLDWWISALRYPATRRVFTPFYRNAIAYHSAFGRSSEAQLENSYAQIIGGHSLEIAPGPTELVKAHGFIRDRDYSVWGTKGALQTLKKELRLVPGLEKNAPTWFLSTPLHGMDREAIFSNAPVEKIQRGTNIFRAIWDLSYGDARLIEIQSEVLKRVLNES